jgi:hypothetical protein
MNSLKNTFKFQNIHSLKIMLEEQSFFKDILL